MIYLLFLGDGKRDAVMVPHLVENILGTQVKLKGEGDREENPTRWAHLHGAGKGYARKLLFAMRQVRNRGADGLVATLDADEPKRSGRLKTLQEARKGPKAPLPRVPTALGEAVPNGEAWLLDDPKAVREGLGLPPDTNIPNVARTKDPKQALHSLLESSPRAGERPLDVIPGIARQVNLERCNHADQTGFRDFVEDIKRELGPLAPQ